MGSRIHAPIKIGDILWHKRSRFTPKLVAKTFVKVTDAQVQRVQDISEEDAIAEGVEYVSEYSKLWNWINGKRGHPWSANPWVWAYTFERIEKPKGCPI